MSLIWLLSFILIVCNQLTKAATHWIVTEDGKIQTHDDSVFILRRPYDLVSLLEQEKRAEAIKLIKRQLMVAKETLEGSNGQEDSGREEDIINGETDVEKLVYSTNEDCAEAAKPLPEFDLYIGTMLFLSPQKSVLLAHDATSENVKENIKDSDKMSGDVFINKFNLIDDQIEPNCTSLFNLDFSMNSYEHLHSMKNRKNLMIDPENDIHVTIASIQDLSDYGTSVYQALKQNHSSWILYTMASYYWRAKGNGNEAVECLRRALHFCPHHYKHIPLTSLGNVLHRAHNSEEAAIVMHHAIDVCSENPISHFTLGNIYAVLADYNKSLICYDNVLKLDKNFAEAKLRYHAVLCHQKVEKALRMQHDSLQKTLEELQGYQKQQELWLHHQQKLLSEQAPPGVLLEQRLQYREHKIREIIDSASGGNGLTNGAPTSVKKINHGTVNGGPGGGSGSSAGAMNQGTDPAGAPTPSCSSASTGDGHAECHIVPILIPITFVPPS